MPSVVEVTLQRSTAGPWGLRLQGGVDFEKTLLISHVTEGTPSHASGLMSGDVVLEIAGRDATQLTHKQAQDAIISCGNRVPLRLQRNVADTPQQGSAWRPQVQVVGGPAVTPGAPGQTYTKTSLAAAPAPQDDHWDVRHNITAKGFQPSPNDTPGFKSVAAPVTKPGHIPSGPPQLASCWMCPQPILGIFVQVKGRPTHPQCFKCSICSESLKNVGHILVGDSLYCSSCHQRSQAAKPQQHDNNFQPQSMPQGLAANLSRLASTKQPSPAAGQGHSQAPNNDWSQKLNADKAGMATNAEDFTKQFMKQLTGGQ